MDFEQGSVVDTWQDGLTIPESADLMGFSSTIIYQAYSEWPDTKKNNQNVQLETPCLCQRKTGRPAQDDEKTTVAQKSRFYNKGVQNTIFEHTTRQTTSPNLKLKPKTHTSSQCCQLRARNRDYISHWLTKTGQKYVGTSPPGQISDKFGLGIRDMTILGCQRLDSVDKPLKQRV